jgi:hypothetical protein
LFLRCCIRSNRQCIVFLPSMAYPISRQRSRSTINGGRHAKEVSACGVFASLGHPGFVQAGIEHMFFSKLLCIVTNRHTYEHGPPSSLHVINQFGVRLYVANMRRHELHQRVRRSVYSPTDYASVSQRRQRAWCGPFMGVLHAWATSLCSLAAPLQEPQVTDFSEASSLLTESHPLCAQVGV